MTLVTVLVWKPKQLLGFEGLYLLESSRRFDILMGHIMVFVLYGVIMLWEHWAVFKFQNLRNSIKITPTHWSWAALKTCCLICLKFHKMLVIYKYCIPLNFQLYEILTSNLTHNAKCKQETWLNSSLCCKCTKVWQSILNANHNETMEEKWQIS